MSRAGRWSIGNALRCTRAAFGAAGRAKVKYARNEIVAASIKKAMALHVAAEAALLKAKRAVVEAKTLARRAA